MKIFAKTVLFAVSLLLLAGPGYAAESAKVNAKASAAAGKDAVKDKAADTKTAPLAKLIDINSATDAELKAVPGIGDIYAAKIIAGRPYANKAQLKSRNILPAKVYEQVKDMIIAKLIKK